jgi:predicted exporter
MKNTRLLALSLWILSLAVCGLIIARTQFVADMSAFLPKAPNARQQMLVEQLRDGIIARLIMVGIEADSAAERARLSEALAQSLRSDPVFVGVQNGSEETLARDQAYYFDNRYLLSPTVTAERFTSAGLKDAIGASIEALSGSAGLMLKKLLPRDPTGETLALIEQFGSGEQPRNLEGVWASRDGKRALLLVQTRAAGSDIDAQAAAIAKIQQVFTQIPERRADARLLLTGAGVFSVSSRQLIEGEVSKLAGASILLVVCLLLAIYRSPRLLVLGLLPVFSGALAGIAAVSLGFGSIHGLTLGFGTTLIGEAVDYSIYLFIQRADTGDARGFWRTIRLGVLTSIAGFAVLLFSGFPGLAQLGLYSISGLIAAALVTRFVLPQLMPAQLRLRDLSGFSQSLSNWATRLQRLKLGVPVLLIAALVLLVWRGDSVWNRELGALSPVPAADQQLDAELRGDMGAPEMRYMLVLKAANAEQALQAAEKLAPPLRELTQAGVIAGFTSPANVLPSQASQAERRAALPPEEGLRMRLREALAGMPIQAERLEGFVADIAKARAAAPLNRASLDGTSSALHGTQHPADHHHRGRLRLRAGPRLSGRAHAVPALVGLSARRHPHRPGDAGLRGRRGIASQLSEIGVMLLMFGVGLHFSLDDLLAVKRIAVPGAVVQMGWPRCWAWRWPGGGAGAGAGLVFGLSLSCASTVVLLKALETRACSIR